MLNKLVYNNTDYDDVIVNGSGQLDLTHAMVGETLSVDTLEVTIKSATAPAFVSNGPGLYYINSTLVGKYYLHEIQQTGKNQFTMIFYSAVYLLGQSFHLGGMYTNTPVSTVLASIMGSMSYTVDEDIGAIELRGYLPYATRRLNLQRLLMATGGALRNNPDGSLRVTSLTDTVVGTFGDNRVFIGGSIQDKNPCTAVQVTEHNYNEVTAAETLYYNTTVDTETIYLDEPHHDYTITGGTISSSGVNYVTFTGAGLVTITGQKYIHVTRVITHGTAPTGADTDVVRSVTDNTLISPYNATEIAEKLYDYLSVANSIRADVLFGTERPGDVVNILHPYTEEAESATIKSMSVTMGGTENRARGEFLVGYTPPSLIAGFENYAVLTGSGSWTVPAGVTKIRVILVGGGDGGDGGANGAKGPQITTPGPGGAGGTGGEKGIGGLVFENNLIVTPAASISYACGSAGSGGAVGTAGTDGTDTTFGSYSSSLGRAYPEGYYEPKSQSTLGKDGTGGISGKTGTAYSATPESVVPETITFNNVTYTSGYNGANSQSPDWNKWAGGGGGGGAAVGNDGVDGQDGGRWFWNYDKYDGYHGAGGNGASATIAGADATGYGCGGSGGHGGGGGGFGIRTNTPTTAWSGLGGSGGTGTAGGDATAGVVIVYY